MIRRANECVVEVRNEMRGGIGDIEIKHFWKTSEINSETRLCAQLTIAVGNSIGFHNHENEEEFFIILSGKGEVDDNGNVAEVNVGDTILTGNGAGHSIKNIGDEPLLIMAVIVPFTK